MICPAKGSTHINWGGGGGGAGEGFIE